MGSKRNTSSEIVSGMQTVASAVKQYFANKMMNIDGKPVKAGDVITFLQGQATAWQNADADHASWLQAVTANHAVYDAQVKPMLAGIKAYVGAILGTTSAEYRAFGYKLPKKGQPGVEVKAVAVAKQRATRKARNTLGSKQRLAITGSVPPATASPVASGPSSASPAPVAAASGNPPNGTNGQSH